MWQYKSNAMNGKVILDGSIRERVSPAESTLYELENEVRPGADRMKLISSPVR